jgi:DNA modification methylase
MSDEFLLTDLDEEKEYTLLLKKKSPPSIYHINYRSVYTDDYPAKFDDELARMLIRLYTEPGEIVADPMAGSGIIPLVAASLWRAGIYQDVNKLAHDLFRKKSDKRIFSHLAGIDSYLQDSRKEIAEAKFNNKIDLILFSPPFGLTIDAAHDKYSESLNDIANSKNYDEWRKSMIKILANCFKVLKPGGLAIIETRPRAKKGTSYPLNQWLIQDGLEIGFEFFQEMIEIVQPFRMWSFGDATQRKAFPMHSYLTFLRKPENHTLDNFEQAPQAPE